MMPDENRVFDVARPGRTSANPTSKPVIVGHRPTMADPMVRDKDEHGGPTHIVIQDSTPPSQSEVLTDDAHREPASGFTSESGLFTSPGASEPMLSHQDEPQFMPAPETSVPPSRTEPDKNIFPVNDLTSVPDNSQPPEPGGPALDQPAAAADTEQVAQEPAHVEGLRVGTPKRRSPLKWIVIALLVLIVGGYLLIDTGTVGRGINLPFHIFKQKKPAPEAASNTSNNNQSQNSVASVPAGFTDYKISGTTLTFAAPTAWGTPTSSNDPGYLQRGGSNTKPDGTYAYLVDFATNKDVEVAVTASKYLPATRATLYYDFLQWCVGTNDGKIYESALNFTTNADKTQTPSTITCNQGPVDATKLDTTTIVQAKAKSTDGKVIGDIYTKNLDSTELPVFRVKDVTSANTDNIKLLLNTVKAGS